MKAFAWVLCLVGAAVLFAAFSPPVVSAEADTTMSAPVTAPCSPNLGETDDGVEGKATCRNCGSGSSGACSGAQQCRGTEAECRKKGCKDTGYSSCSTAANVKIC